jgi:hypothetical protein
MTFTTSCICNGHLVCLIKLSVAFLFSPLVLRDVLLLWGNKIASTLLSFHSFSISSDTALNSYIIRWRRGFIVVCIWCQFAQLCSGFFPLSGIAVSENSWTLTTLIMYLVSFLSSDNFILFYLFIFLLWCCDPTRVLIHEVSRSHTTAQHSR